MDRTADDTRAPLSVHGNGRSGKPRRRWKPRWAYDRSMRAYEQNPRALGTNERNLTPFHSDTPLS